MSLQLDNSMALRSTDEVESLTAARAGAMAGTEPTDALRVWFPSSNFPCSADILAHIGRQCIVDAIRQAQTQEERASHVNE